MRMAIASLVSFRHRFFRAAEQPLDLGLLFDYLPDTYFYAKNPRGQFVMVNRAMAGMFGATDPEEMIGKTDYDFSPQTWPISTWRKTAA